MKCTKKDLDTAVEKGIINRTQSDLLWKFLEGQSESQSSFEMANVIYYFGGIILLSSMTWFFSSAWKNGLELSFISLFFGLLYLFIGTRLWAKKLEVPGGLFITTAVCLVPVAIFGLQRHLDFWPHGDLSLYPNYRFWIKGNMLLMEIGTIIAAALALKFFSFPFLTFPITLALWYMSVDLTPLFFGQADFTYHQTLWVSLIFGLATLLLAYVIDIRRHSRDFAFWLYLYGAVAFWSGISLLDSDNEFTKFLYCLLNVGFIFFSVFIRRKIFLILGAIGVFGYISYLVYEVFKDSQLFPIVLSVIGLFIIFAGIFYQRQQEKIEAFVEKLFPNALSKIRPPKRG